MPYKPENDISENIIYRNSKYKKSDISCCTCSICIKSNYTASLKLFNFKEASPIVNESSIGSTITYFYNYMMPNGEFDYILDAVVSKNQPTVKTENEPNGLADYLIYYPFRNCTGVDGGGQNYLPDDPCPWITSYVTPYGEVEKFNYVAYSSRFLSSFYNSFGTGQAEAFLGCGLGDYKGFLAYGLAYIPYDSAFAYAFLNAYAYSNVYPHPSNEFNYYSSQTASSIEYDNYYGTYLTKNINPSPNQKWFNYPLKGVYCFPSICNDILFRNIDYPTYSYYGYRSIRGDIGYLPDNSIIQSCENVNTPPWNTIGQIPYNADSIYFSDGIPYGSYNVSYDGENYNLLHNSFFDVHKIYLLNAYAGGVFYTANVNNQLSPSIYDYPNAPTLVGKPKVYQNYYGFDPSVTSGGPNSGYFEYLSKYFNGRIIHLSLSNNFTPSLWYTPDANSPNPCSIQYLKDTYGENSTQQTISPTTIDIGNYEDFIDYIENHDYSNYGFKVGSNCENNIVKIMDAKYISNVDGFSFPYLHPGYSLKSFKYYVTDKFLTPTIGESYLDNCAYKFKKIVNYDTNPDTYGFIRQEIPWINQGLVVFNGDPQMNEIDEPDYSLLAKDGYILKSFKYFNNGNFIIRIGAVDEKDFFITMDKGIDYSYHEQDFYLGGNSGCGFTLKGFYAPWDGFYSSAYWWNTINYYQNISYNYEFNKEVNLLNKQAVAGSRKSYQDVLYSNSHYDESSIQKIAYYNYSSQNDIQQIWFNGIFVDKESSSAPVFVKHFNTCGNQFYTERLIKVSDYIGTKGINTYETFETDASGVTNLIIHNVLFVGKKLIEANFENNAGVNRQELANNNKVPLSYNAFLNGGFECDIKISYRSVPFCKINSIPDKMKRSDKLKIKFENYSKIIAYQTTTTDYGNFYKNENPYDWMADSQYLEINPNTFIEYVFSPPTKNQNNYFYIQKYGNFWKLKKSYTTIDPKIEKKFFSGVTAYNKKFSQNEVYGRMYGNDYSDDYKSSFYIKGTPKIWETGNKIKINAPIPLNNIFLKNKDYYCIFVKNVSQNENSEQYCQIRIAETFQKAINGEYIEIKDDNGKAIYAKTFNSAIGFEITYKDDIKENTKDQIPGYFNFYPQQYNIINSNLEKLNIPYTISNFRSSGTYGELSASVDSSFDPSLERFNFTFVNSQNNVVFSKRSHDYLEVVSFSPLKIILRNSKFLIDTTLEEFRFNFNMPGVPFLNKSSGYFGFTCDIVIEEDVDEYTIPSLPNDFNRISSMINEINTQQPYQEKERKQLFVIPEKCTHIGKVIDRKNCNCPKKWIRECEVFGTTDWNNCMRCDKFEYED